MIRFHVWHIMWAKFREPTIDCSMRKTHILLLIIFSCFLAGPGASQHQKTNYFRLWKKVHGYELDDLPKSAAVLVDSIHTLAKKESRPVQSTKALIYKSKFISLLEEEAQIRIIEGIQREIDHSTAPTRNLLESMLAQCYWQYFRDNRWRIYNRTRTKEKSGIGDFRVWSVDHLFLEIQRHFQNSLKERDTLKKTPLYLYDELLELKEGSKKVRPTLYDFLVHNALDFYKTDENSITKPANKFELNDTMYFNDLSELSLIGKDTTTLQYQALKLFKDLSQFHLDDSIPDARAELEIERLKFVRSKSILRDSDSLYLNALKRLGNQYEGQEISARIGIEIAKFYFEQGQKYATERNETYRFEKVKALEICERIITQYPNGRATFNCELLKEQILKKQLDITVEKHIPNHQNSRILIDYVNIDSLYFKVFSLDLDQVREINMSRYRNDSLKVINKLIPMSTWKSGLRSGNDYQRHQTEVLLPGYENGNYLLVASTEEDMLSGIYAYDIVQFTDLLLLSNGNYQNNQFQVVNRVTGEPLAGAKVRFSNQHIKDARSKINKMDVADKDGFIYADWKKWYRQVDISVSYNEEGANFSNYYLSQPYRSTNTERERIIAKPFLFTDRSIYRPGQKVYFKGILVSQQGTESRIVANQQVEVYLDDPNGEEVGFLELNTNEYGSFSGEFILPSGGITGTYDLYVDEGSEVSEFFDEIMDNWAYNQSNISVEEYKLPRFNVEFDPVTDLFRLNDTLAVSGHAIAFAGSKISDAKVVYRVQRSVQYPGWYAWDNGYSSDEQEITYGETTTDANGQFVIEFKAIPNPKIPRNLQPTFTYTITADITDINGETRSAEGTVKVGYHAMVASVATKKVDKNRKDNAFLIRTKNLNGEFTPSNGKIRIYRLTSPTTILRKRPWPAPDFQGFTFQQFRQLFPHDPYATEDQEKEWKRGKLVYESNFDTQETRELRLGNMKKWESGKYIIELRCEDGFGQEVRDEARFEVIDPKEKSIPANQLFSITLDKESYRVGEKAKVKLSSASPDLSVTVTIEKKGNRAIKVVHFQNNTAELELPIDEGDQGGFSILYHFANFNAFESGTLTVSVLYDRPQLSIERQTFRNKIQPGADQTWSFKISGSEGERVAAEVLASMYDASLDKFKPHRWSFNPFQPRYNRSYNSWSARNSLRTTSFIVKNQRWHTPGYIDQKFDQLNWFGFNISGRTHDHQNYLRDLRKSRMLSSVENSTNPQLKKGTVAGQIVDLNGNPIPGASIVIQGTGEGTISDMDGFFSIQAKKSDRLYISFIGYTGVYLKVRNHNTFNVILTEDVENLDEVVVVGYGLQRKLNSVAAGVNITEETVVEEIVFAEVADEEEIEVELGVYAGGGFDLQRRVTEIRGATSIPGANVPLYVVDGVVVSEPDLDPDDVFSIQALKGASASAIYGSRAANGALIITTKAGQRRIEQELAAVKVRKNLHETAFFLPHLQTDNEGNVSFDFTVPEALTRWKFQMLAHSKELASAIATATTITQKDLMVIPNAPRFLRAGDQISFSSKITNLTNRPMNGLAALQLYDAITGRPIDTLLNNLQKNRHFTVTPKGNTNISWALTIPADVQAVQYRVVAKAGDFSDGEQNILPVLSNRTLVTETLPFWVNSNQSKTFVLEKLKDNKSKTLRNHKLTLEVTSNPVWYALKALPYLMEYPYECAEQTFSRYYANRLGSHVVNSNPRLKEVFDQWEDSGALTSNLEKNQELKSLLIQETPWLRDAQNESEQKKRMALLFDLNNMKDELSFNLKKLLDMQFANGGFPWFTGSKGPNRYITQHIVSGFGHLQQLGVRMEDEDLKKMIDKALGYLDSKLIDDYDELLKQIERIKSTGKTPKEAREEERAFWSKQHLNQIQIQYLYMRSFYTKDISEKLRPAFDFYVGQSKKHWKDQNNYMRGMIALTLYREGNEAFPEAILRSLEENSMRSEEFGMYWKEYERQGWWWYQSAIETQALLIEAFVEIQTDIFSEKEQQEIVDQMKIWLLKNKQTKQWKSTKATTEAVYALLLLGSDWISIADAVEVEVGNQYIELSEPDGEKTEVGTGYFKTSWSGSAVEPEMSKVSITKKSDGITWGGLYWQYFEELDKITSASTPLQIKKQLFYKYNTDLGEEMKLITDSTALKIGDLVRVRIEVRVDREMDFVHMKDMRASGFEPINVLSQYKWQDGLGYYESTKDASTHFFFETLKKGVHVFEYDLRANIPGNFSNGITTLQSMYAPEFSSHSEGIKVEIVE